MAIELMDKIKPKGGGDFPMVDAADVEMSDGRRLPEALGDVSGIVVSPEPPENKNALWIDPMDNSRDNTIAMAEALGQIDALLGGDE